MGKAACFALGLSLGVWVAGCERHDAAPKPAPSVSAAGAPSAAVSASRALPSASAGVPCITLESVGAVALTELAGENADETAAIAAASRELKRVLEVPEDYFATVQTAGDLVLLELWHRSAFSPENCAGNRCTKCRTQAYDPKLRRIVSTKVWEQLGREAEPLDRRSR